MSVTGSESNGSLTGSEMSGLSDTSSVASSVFEQYQVRTRAQRRLDELRAAKETAETAEDAESVNSDISSEQTKLDDANDLINAINIDKANIAEFEEELQKLYSDQGEGENKITDEEFQKFLEELGITSSAPGSTTEEKPSTVQRGDNQVAPENSVGLNQPQPPPPPTTVKANVSLNDIGEELEKMNYKDVNIKIENDEIKVEATAPPAATGGKSKKKQMKYKNKSNKKMKKKQTKKGGKQMKKRSLKRKIKK